MKNAVKTKADVETLKAGGVLLAKILLDVVRMVVPGVTAADLDEHAERLMREAGGTPAFKGYRAFGAKTPYPATLCISVNDEVVHGIPRRSRVFKEGDIVGIDIGMWYPAINKKQPHSAEASSGKQATRSMVTDMAVTVGVGKISSKAEKLLRVTKEALHRGIETVRPGVRVGDIGAAIQAHIERYGFGVVRELAGHGVGYLLHEEPFIPNYGAPGDGPILREGMVIAIEPMATEGAFAVKLDKDEWTFRTKDGGLAAHFEHTVVVTDRGGLIVTQE